MHKTEKPSKPRAVLDSNIWISAFLVQDRLPAMIADVTVAGEVHGIISDYIIEEIGCGGFFVDGRHACESLRNVFSQDGKFVWFPSNLMSSPVLAASSKIKLYRSSVVGQFWRTNVQGKFTRIINYQTNCRSPLIFQIFFKN